jgi:hypothetical protein
VAYFGFDLTIPKMEAYIVEKQTLKPIAHRS